MKKGLFVIIDGLDGIGKGVCLDALKEEASDMGWKIFDVNEYWVKENNIPSFEEIGDVDLLITSEPTYQGIGKHIREKLICKDGMSFSTSVLAQAYSLDRQILYEKLIIPAIEKGINIFQSRSVTTSIVYQKLTGKEDGVNMDFILNLEGNKLALENAPDYLIIPMIKNVEEVMNRLENRAKEDNCKFENLEFQLKAKEEYESGNFKKIFEGRGTKLEYIDVGRTVEDSKSETKEFFRKNLV